jgi:segregation and condensation protein B
MNEAVDDAKLKAVIDAVLLAAGEPVSVNQILKLFGPGELAGDDVRARVRACLKELESDAAGRGYQLKRVASGYRYQVRQELSEWVSRLWDEKPPRFSRALIETLALVAYKQPVTRGDIEQVRGVSVSPNIMRTLLERGWIRVVGQREAPGRPSMYGTTRAFLDYFNLRSLDQLPPLEEIRSLIEPIVVSEEAEEPLRPEVTVEMPSDMTEIAQAAEESESQEAVGAEVVPLPSVPQ